MSEKVPDVPAAYEPTTSVPVEPYEPIPNQPDGPLPSRPVQAATGTTDFSSLSVFFVIVWVMAVIVVAVQVVDSHRSAERSEKPAAVVMPAVPVPPVPAELRSEWPELSAEVSSAVFQARSTRTGTPTAIHFHNLSGEPATVTWLDYDDQPVGTFEVPHGEGFDQQTFTGHVWLVTRPDGRTQKYAASSDPTRVIIRFA